MKSAMKLTVMAFVSLAAAGAHGADLLTVYQDALANDPQVREAEANRQATHEAKPQAWSVLLPQISGSATKEKQDIDQNTVTPQLGLSDPTDPTSPVVVVQQAIVGS